VPPDEGQPYEAGAFGYGERAFHTLACLPQRYSGERGKPLLFLHKDALKSVVTRFSVFTRSQLLGGWCLLHQPYSDSFQPNLLAPHIISR